LLALKTLILKKDNGFARPLLGWMALLPALAIPWACEKKSDSHTDSSSSEPNLSAWGSFYPLELQVESWSQEAHDQPDLGSWAADAQNFPFGFPSTHWTWLQNKYLGSNPPASCLHPSLLGNPKMVEESCYQPGTSMLFGSIDGALFGTQNGSNAKGEACLPAAQRSLSLGTKVFVDKALASFQTSFCQLAKVNQPITLPEKSTATDLKKHLKEFGGVFSQVSEFKLARLGDFEGKPTYQWTLKFENGAGKKFSFMLTMSNQSQPNLKKWMGVLNGSITQEKSSFGAEMNQIASLRFQASNDPKFSFSEDTSFRGMRYKWVRKGALFTPDAGESVFLPNGDVDFNKNSDLQGNYSSLGQVIAQGENYASDFHVWLGATLGGQKHKMVHWTSRYPEYYAPAAGMVWEMALDPGNGIQKGCFWEGSSRVESSSLGVPDYSSLRRSAMAEKDLALRGFYHPTLYLPEEGGDLFQGCAIKSNQTSGSDRLHQVDCPGGVLAGGTSIKWYKPRSSSADAQAFFSNQAGSTIVKQCFKKENSQGKYEVDHPAPELNSKSDASHYGFLKWEEIQEKLTYTKYEEVPSFNFSVLP
jgi:hypothetical protein